MRVYLRRSVPSDLGSAIHFFRACYAVNLRVSKPYVTKYAGRSQRDRREARPFEVERFTHVT
jgi:hypothetical protein